MPLAGPVPAPPAGWRVEAIALARPGDVTVRGWLVLPPVDRARVVTYFGGNAEEVSWLVADADRFGGRALALLNYRGFGGSGGKPGEDALVGDAIALHRHARRAGRHRARRHRRDGPQPRHRHRGRARVEAPDRSRGAGVAVRQHRGRRRPLLSRGARARPDRRPLRRGGARPARHASRCSRSSRATTRSSRSSDRAAFTMRGAVRSAGSSSPRARHNDLQSYPAFWREIGAFLAER